MSGTIALDPPASNYRGAMIDITKFIAVKADLYGWFGIAGIYENGWALEGIPSLIDATRRLEQSGIWCLKFEPSASPWWLRGDRGFPAFFSSRERAERFQRAWLAQNAPALFMRDYPTTCPNCGDTFRTLDDLVGHMSSDHTSGAARS